MILVDASLRIDPVRNGDAGLADPLGTGRVLAHSFVTGELALVSLRPRRALLDAPQPAPRDHGQ